MSPSNMPRCIAVNVFKVSDYLFIALGQILYKPSSKLV